MSKIQPGVGYNVTNSSSGISLDIEQQGWTPPGDQVILAAQFDPVFNFAPEYVNHYKVNVPEQQIEGSFVLKIAKGGNVWMPQGSTCALEKRADVITTDGTTLVVVPGADADSPWASDDGYIVLTSGGEVAYYVYAYKVETADLSEFYIYASTDDTLADSCPATLPDGIIPPSDPYDVQVVMVASVAWSVESLAFVVNQHVVGSITWPGITGGGSTEYVNQFEMAVKNVDVEGTITPVLKVASGGHIYRPISSTCDKTDFTDVITPDPSGPSPVAVVAGTGTSNPWASSDGYVEISAGSFYAYALKVENETEADFYIYVSKDGTLDSACPVPIPAGITAPTGDYTVQCLKIGSATYTDGTWTIEQKLIGSITWPSNQSVQIPEQFETRVLASTEEGVWQVQVALGRVIVGGGRQAVGEYDVQAFAIYPTGSLTNGSDSESPYVNQGGYVEIANADNDGADSWGVYIVSNPSEGNYPMLAVIADGSDADTKSQPWTTRVAWIDVCPYTVSVITTPTPPYEVYLKSYDTVSSQHQANYNCQRIKIATLYWDSVHSNWIVRQWLIGSLTNPSIEWWNGNREYNSDDGIPSWATTTDYQTEQDAWLGTWTGYYKWNGSGAHPSTNILP